MPEVRQIRRLLVANRGEIPRRIFATCREMGISTVAVYSDPDADLPFVHDADLAVALHGSTSAETYLDVDAVIDAARRTAADAVHPGYGFLAENAAAAQAVEEAGLIWVGPRPEQIAAMASKIAAKALAAAVGVPVPPSAALTSADEQDWRDAASKVGFPLLVKASASGGGKGMRLVHVLEEVVEAVSASRREAAAAFGDDEVFLERWLSPARHVEVQVLGDVDGAVGTVGERECSIQRRHQKVIEESPSPGITEATRSAMTASAVRLAEAIGYLGVGTVEFLVVGDGDAQEYLFLEMNTRLQVEHSVTELVHAVDLVREQLLIAMGHPLDVSRLLRAPVGHAIEARVYAEDPAADHLPSTGLLDLVDPADGPRWDLAVWTGSVVSPYYDPMLAKATVFGETREQAADRLAGALRRTRVHGVRTNIASLVATLASASFRSGDTTTDFFDRHPEVLAPTLPVDVAQAHLLAAAVWTANRERAAAQVVGFAPAGWRNVPGVLQRREYRSAGGHVVEYDEPSPTYRVDGVTHVVTVHAADADGVDLVVDGVRRRCQVAAYGQEERRRVHVHSADGESVLHEVPRFSDTSATEAARGPMAPMPGTVTAVEVKPGDTVQVGQVLVRLEAMKMEHRIVADVAGAIASVPVSVGDSVDAHQVLVLFEAVLDE